MSQATVKEAVSKTLGAVQSNPNAAKLTYEVATKWEGDVRCTAKVRDFDSLVVDEPPAFGGSDKGMSPVELTLAALGSCQEIMYAALASVMDIPLDKVEVKLVGHLDLHGLFGLGADKGIPPGFQKIEYETRIDSPASEADLRRLIEAVEAQCPLLDMMKRPLDVAGKVVINDKAGPGEQKTAA